MEKELLHILRHFLGIGEDGKGASYRNHSEIIRDDREKMRREKIKNIILDISFCVVLAAGVIVFMWL